MKEVTFYADNRPIVDPIKVIEAEMARRARRFNHLIGTTHGGFDTGRTIVAGAQLAALVDVWMRCAEPMEGETQE